MLHDFNRDILRHGDADFILGHMARHHFFLPLAARRKCAAHRLFEHMDAVAVVNLIDRESIAVLRDICPHIDAEAVLIAVAAADQHIVKLLAASLIEPVLLAPVVQIHVVEALHRLQIAAPKEEEHRSRVDIRLLALLFREEEQGLRERRQRLFCGVIGLRLEFNRGSLFHFVVNHGVNVREAPRSLFADRSKNAVLFPKFFQSVLKSFFCQYVTH